MPPSPTISVTRYRPSITRPMRSGVSSAGAGSTGMLEVARAMPWSPPRRVSRSAAPGDPHAELVTRLGHDLDHGVSQGGASGHLDRDGRDHALLDHALQRAGAAGGVEAEAGQELAGGGVDAERQVAAHQAGAQGRLLELEV